MYVNNKNLFAFHKRAISHVINQKGNIYFQIIMLNFADREVDNDDW